MPICKNIIKSLIFYLDQAHRQATVPQCRREAGCLAPAAPNPAVLSGCVVGVWFEWAVSVPALIES
jgi:hypothetical protein